MSQPEILWSPSERAIEEAQVTQFARQMVRKHRLELNTYPDFHRWTVENPSSEHPRIANRSDQYYSAGNTYWLRDADYIRLKNFELGYTIPELLGQRAGIKSLRALK